MIPGLPVFAYVNIFALHKCKWWKTFAIPPALICLLNAFCIERCLPQVAGGTTIIINGMRDTVVVAADSWTISYGKVVDSLVCKIRQVDDSTFFTMAGVTGTVRHLAAVPNFIESTLKTSKPIRLAWTANQVSNFLPEKLRASIINSSGEDSTKPIASFFLFGRDRGMLGVFVRHFYWRNNFTEIAVRDSEDWDLSLGERAYVFSIEEVNRHINFSALPRSMVASVEAIAETSIVYGPHTTGIPFDVVCVTRTSHEWIHKKPNCN